MKNITARITATGKGTKNYQSKEVIASYSFIVATRGRGLQEVVRAKLYMGRSKSASTVYANVWIFGPSSAHRGSGSAGGYGYHKESEALARAFEDAGVRLYHTPKGSTEEVPFYFGGTGTSYYEEIFAAIAKAVGQDGPSLLVSV